MATMAMVIARVAPKSVLTVGTRVVETVSIYDLYVPRTTLGGDAREAAIAAPLQESDDGASHARSESIETAWIGNYLRAEKGRA
jgi:hypothetical protein